MVYTIKKGRHRAWPLRLGLAFRRRAFRRIVSFLNYEYHIEGEDMADTNKLFGIGFLWNHHKESARVRWRWDPEKRMVLLSAYCYVGGARIIESLAWIDPAKPATISIYVETWAYFFHVIQDGIVVGYHSVKRFHRKKWSFPQGLYFGGNQAAPERIRVDMKKL